MRREEPDVEIPCEVRAETEKAIQIHDGVNTVWIPRSQITDEVEEDGKITAIFVKHWLAKEKGLI